MKTEQTNQTEFYKMVELSPSLGVVTLDIFQADKLARTTLTAEDFKAYIMHGLLSECYSLEEAFTAGVGFNKYAENGALSGENGFTVEWPDETVTYKFLPATDDDVAEFKKKYTEETPQQEPDIEVGELFGAFVDKTTHEA